MLDDLTGKAIQTLWEEFNEAIERGTGNLILILLKLMGVVFWLAPEYRKNIDEFGGRYQFLSKDEEIKVSAVFCDGKLTVKEDIIQNPHVTIIFRDAKSLLNFLFSPKPDILESLLNHNLQTKGNLNYVYKLGYMANHLRLMMPQFG